MTRSSTRRRRRARRARRGAAYVEFLLAFMPILTLFLGLVQLGLLFSANLVVQHAAHRSLRAAVVILDDDPRYYDGEPRLIVDGARATSEDLETQLARRDEGERRGGRGMSRRGAIELAALIVISSVEPRRGDSIAESLGSLDVAQRSISVREHTDVDLHIQHPPTGTTEPPMVRVRVEHGFACRVPIVRGWICRGGRRMLDAEDWGPVHVAHMMYGEGDWGSE